MQEGVKYRVFRATKGWNDELLMASSEFPVEEDGTFRIFPIDCDEATLVVDVETSFLSKTVATRSLGNLLASEERHVTIDLPPLDLQEIEFMARSRATGQPITEWGLGWAPTNAPHGRSGWRRIESAEGRASLLAPEGDYRFEATADGYLPPPTQAVSVPLSQDPPRVLFLLEPTQTYRIRLVDDQGRPLPDVRFELFSMDSPKRVTRELGPHQHVHLEADASGSTDKNGELEVSQVPPGWYYGKIVEYGKPISTDGTRTFADIEWDQIRERDLRVHLVPQGGLIEVTIER